MCNRSEPCVPSSNFGVFILAIRSGLLTSADWDLWEAGGEVSHLCHRPYCENPTHVVIESRHANMKRGMCVSLLPDTGPINQGVVCPHTPACHLRPKKELYSLDYLIQKIATLRQTTLDFVDGFQTFTCPVCGAVVNMSGKDFVAHVVKQHTDPVAEHMTVESTLKPCPNGDVPLGHRPVFSWVLHLNDHRRRRTYPPSRQRHTFSR